MSKWSAIQRPKKSGKEYSQFPDGITLDSLQAFYDTHNNDKISINRFIFKIVLIPDKNLYLILAGSMAGLPLNIITSGLNVHDCLSIVKLVSSVLFYWLFLKLVLTINRIRQKGSDYDEDKLGRSLIPVARANIEFAGCYFEYKKIRRLFVLSFLFLVFTIGCLLVPQQKEENNMKNENNIFETMEEINENVINAYDTIANDYASAYADNDETDFKYFNYFLNHIPGRRILDMGCGVGVNANYLTQRGFTVLGVDASSGMLRNARMLYPSLHFEQHNILHLPYPDNSFDGIVLAYVIEHFNDDGLVQLKKEISRLLVDGGLLFITSHEGNGEEIIPDPLDDTVSIYYNFITGDTIKELFQGFYVVDYQSRASYGPEEFLNDKLFITLQKKGAK